MVRDSPEYSSITSTTEDDQDLDQDREELQSPKLSEYEVEITELPHIDLESDFVNSKEYNHRRNSLKFLEFFWDGYDKHPKEQSFLFKLDWFLLSSAMLGYFIKSLNQSNISTAYLNGMKDYYQMDKNEYNYMLSSWTVGYILGAFPANYLLHKINARVYLGTLEICWGILTFSMISCKEEQINRIYVIRFFVGLFEAAFFPTISFIIGSWYSPTEMTKRSSLFYVSASVAGIISGPLQQFLLETFKDSLLEPFKCMFIFDAIISIPIGIYTLWVNPNTPSTCDAWYFSDEDKLIALERSRRRRRSGSVTVKSSHKSLLKTWHVYVFPVVFLCYHHSGWAIGQPTFQTWMKYDLKLPPSSYNYYPSIISSLALIISLSISYINDYFGGRLNHLFISIVFIISIFGNSLLVKWDIPRWLHWLSYFIIGVPHTTPPPLIYSWINRLLINDEFKRGSLIFATNTLAYFTSSWLQIIVWNSKDAPEYHLGFSFTVFISLLGLTFTLIASFMDYRDKQRDANTRLPLLV